MKLKRVRFYLISFLICAFPNHVLADLEGEKSSSYWAGNTVMLCQLYQFGYLTEKEAKSLIESNFEVVESLLSSTYANKVVNFINDFEGCKRILP